MSAIDNPPAFPRTGEGFGNHSYAPGMTLRDYFAGQALAQATREIWEKHKYEDVARRSYGIADAMLAERAKETGK